MSIDDLFMGTYRREALPAVDVAPAAAAWEAVVADAPDDLGDEVFVTIDGIDEGERLFGPCYWMPRVTAAGDTLSPTAGDSALVVQSNESRYWIIAWWPS